MLPENSTFDLVLLRSFVMVARLKSISKAAERLHRVQSTISLQIQKLETHLEHPLFHRDRSGFALTDVGKALYPHAVRLLDMNDHIQDAVRSHQSPRKLVIGTSDIYASTILADILRRYHRTNGPLQTEVICDYSPAIWKKFEEGLVDVAIAQECPPTIDGESLAVDPLVWVQAPGFEIQKRPLPLALFGEGCAERAMILKRLGEANIAFEIVSESVHSAGVMATVRAGIAISALPRSVVSPHTVLPHPGEGLPLLGRIHLSMAWKGGCRNDHINHFRDHVESYFHVRHRQTNDAMGAVPFFEDFSEESIILLGPEKWEPVFG